MEGVRAKKPYGQCGALPWNLCRSNRETRTTASRNDFSHNLNSFGFQPTEGGCQLRLSTLSPSRIFSDGTVDISTCCLLITRYGSTCSNSLTVLIDE
jgi:hypothetical protein